jgi:hypothetical protein
MGWRRKPEQSLDEWGQNRQNSSPSISDMRATPDARSQAEVAIHNLGGTASAAALCSEVASIAPWRANVIYWYSADRWPPRWISQARQAQTAPRARTFRAADHQRQCDLRRASRRTGLAQRRRPGEYLVGRPAGRPVRAVYRAIMAPESGADMVPQAPAAEPGKPGAAIRVCTHSLTCSHLAASV